MNKRSFRIPLLVSALLAAGSAFAAPRTYVASFGSDANTATNCAPTAPCRTFAAAQTVTDSRGEIIALDTAGYGTIAITKSLSIIAPDGIYAGISSASGDAITINTPGVDVILRGLNINGQGTSSGSGVKFQDGASLLVDRCVITGFGNTGALANSSVGVLVLKGKATVTNSVVRGNNRGGIVFRGTGTTADTFIRGAVMDTLLESNGAGWGDPEDAGLAAVSGALVTVRNSSAIGNFRGYATCGNLSTAPAAVMTVENSLASRNVVGAFVAPNNAACAMRMSGSTITDNTLYGIEQQNGSVVTSMGNNLVYDNAAGESFGLTATLK